MNFLRNALGITLAFALSLFSAGVDAQTGPTPNRSQAQTFVSYTQLGRAIDITASTASFDEVLGAAGPVATVYNTGSNWAYIGLTSVASSVTAANGIPVGPGACAFLNAQGMTHIQAITATGGTTLQVGIGWGNPGSCGGGSGSGGGGGGGAISIGVGAVSAGAYVDGAISTLGTLSDTAYNGSGNASTNALLKGLYTYGVTLRGSSVSIGSVTLNAGAATIGAISNTAFGISGTLPAFASTPTVNIGTAPTINVAGTFWPYTLGQQLNAASVPVVLTAAQLTTLTPPAAVTNYALESGGNLASINTKVPALGQALATSSVPVVLTALQLSELTPPTSVGVTQATAANLNATVVGTGTFAVQATQNGAWTVNPLSSGAWGIGLTGSSPPANAVQIGMVQTGNLIALTGQSGNLNVQCANCSGSGVSTLDAAPYTYASSLFAGTGGFFQTTATNNALTNLQQGMVQLTAQRAMFSNLRNSSGTEIGTSSNPVQVTGSSGTFPVTGTVTANAGTNLNTSALALESGGNLVAVVNEIGALGSTACATDTGSCNINALAQRIAQRLTTVNTTLGSPFQVGSSIGNTSFGATQATAANLNATVVGTGTFAVQATTFGPTAVGSANANPPVVIGGTTTGAAGQNVVGAAVKLGGVAPLSTDTSIVVGINPNSINPNGQTTMANSVSVAIASNQSAVPVFVTGASSSGATAATAPTSANLNGGTAQNAEATAVTNGQLKSFVTDLVGKLINLPYANPENTLNGQITSAMTGTASTAVTGMGTQGAGVRVYATACTFSNTHATVGTMINLQDGSGGAVLWQSPAGPAFNGAAVVFPTPIKTTASNGLFAVNATTGASTFVSCTGYKGA